MHSIPEVPDEATVGSFSDLVSRLEEQEGELSKLRIAFDEFRSLLPVIVRPSETACNSLPKLATQVEQLFELKRMLNKHPIAKIVLGEHFEGWATNPVEYADEVRALEVLRTHGAFAGVLLDLLEAHGLTDAAQAINEVLLREEEALIALSHLSQETGIAFHDRLAQYAPREVASLLREASTDRTGLFANSIVATARRDITDLGLGWVVDALEDAGHSLDQLDAILAAVLYRAMAIRVYEIYGNVLAKYPGTKLDERRATLAKLDREVIKLSRRCLRAKVYAAAQPPAGNGIGRKSTWTEMALIENEASKQQRFISVRDLTHRAGNALRELKPCWMMSPQAVAQYLPTANSPSTFVSSTRRPRCPRRTL